MKKQTIYFTFLIITILIFNACTSESNNSTSTTTAEEVKTIGATGIPEIDALTTQITKNPTDHTLYAARAAAFYKNEGYDNAIYDMASAMKMDSTNADYHHLLSEIYLDYYKSRLALQTMKRCVKLYPKRIPSLLKLAEIEQILEMYDASMSTSTRVLTIDQNNPDAYFIIGTNHILMGNKQMSVKNLKKTVELDPDFSDAWELLGDIFEEDKNPLAEQYFENAVQSAPNNVDILYNKATYLHNNNKLDDASALLKKIVKIDRNYADAFQRLGIIYIEKDSLNKAYDNFNIAVKVDPKLGVAYFYRGYTSELLGNLEAAKRDYQNILNFDPDYEKAKEAIARVTQQLNQ